MFLVVEQLIPFSLELHIGGSTIENVCSLSILGISFDPKMLFEHHLRKVAASASQKLGIMRRGWQLFGDLVLLRRCFNSYILPVLEYCSPVWRSSSDVHLRLLDRVVRQASFMLDGNLRCDLGHRRDVAALCMLFKIINRPGHSLYDSLPGRFVPIRNTRHAANLHSNSLNPVRCRTGQFSRSFVPCTVVLWNSLDEDVFAGGSLGSFKSKVNGFLSC